MHSHALPRPSRARLLAGLALLSGLALTAGLGAAPFGGPTTFADVEPGAPAELDEYQIKFTWTGMQEKSTATILLHGALHAPDVTEFEPHYTAGVHYGNDEDHSIALAVDGPVALGRIFGGLIDRPNLQVSGGASDPVISIMIERGTAPGELVFEHLATPIEAAELVNVLQAAVVFEPPATRDVVRRFRNFTVGQP